MQRYDIIIVGAGPAGANLARLIDADKYKVLVVDGSIGHDKVCGGLISPDAQDILARYDICLPKDLLVSPQLFSVRTIDLCNGTVKHYRRSYLNADRKKLDDFFRSLIPDGVKVIKDRCKKVVEIDGGYTLELVIPWACLSNENIPALVPAAGMTVSVDFGMFDLDFPCPGVATVRMQWAGTDTVDTDPSQWGKLTFCE